MLRQLVVPAYNIRSCPLGRKTSTQGAFEVAHRTFFYDVWGSNPKDTGAIKLYYTTSKPSSSHVRSSSIFGPSTGDHRHPYSITKNPFAAAGRLKDVEDDDVILIEGHGHPGCDSISNLRAGGLSLSANMLAKILIKDLLPKEHKYIRLITCFGGAARADTTSFAARLAMKLGSKNFNSIVVCGYLAEVVGGDRGLNIENKRKDAKLWFDSTGQAIAKPPRAGD